MYPLSGIDKNFRPRLNIFDPETDITDTVTKRDKPSNWESYIEDLPIEIKNYQFRKIKERSLKEEKSRDLLRYLLLVYGRVGSEMLLECKREDENLIKKYNFKMYINPDSKSQIPNVKEISGDVLSQILLKKESFISPAVGTLSNLEIVSGKKPTIHVYEMERSSFRSLCVSSSLEKDSCDKLIKILKEERFLEEKDMNFIESTLSTIFSNSNIPLEGKLIDENIGSIYMSPVTISSQAHLNCIK